MGRFMLRMAPLLVLATLSGIAGAQTPATDPSVRLKQVLPADVAEHVLAVIADARAHDLPAQALENRALKFAANGVDPKDIERSVIEHAKRMEKAQDALKNARSRRPDDDEIDAGAEAMRKGVDGAKVSELAKSAPSGRSLAVPLYVIGSLVDRGVPSDEALKRVLDRLQAKADDRDLEDLPRDLPPQAAAGQSHRPSETGQDLAATKRPGSAGSNASGKSGGPPTTVPGNAGKKTRPTPPTTPGKKPTNPGKKP
jgi:hypothetical protein